MEVQDLLNQIKAMYADMTDNIVVPEIQPNRIDVYIQPEELIPAVCLLRENDWGYLITISAYDTLDENGAPVLGLIYHFGEESVICSLRCFLPHSRRVIESICAIIPSATVYERECMELFGIDFLETPDRSKLLLPDDWPDGVYPMLKSFTRLPKTENDENGGKNG